MVLQSLEVQNADIFEFELTLKLLGLIHNSLEKVHTSHDPSLFLSLYNPPIFWNTDSGEEDFISRRKGKRVED